jgi:hypothetical protein
MAVPALLWRSESRVLEKKEGSHIQATHIKLLTKIMVSPYTTTNEKNIRLQLSVLSLLDKIRDNKKVSTKHQRMNEDRNPKYALPHSTLSYGKQRRRYTA